MTDQRRVVVTGLGIVTPLGFDEATLWQRMISGLAGIDRIRCIDTTDCKTHAGAEVNSETLNSALEEREIRPFDRTVDMGVLAAAQALEQAGLVSSSSGPPSPLLMATIFGTGAGSSVSLGNVYMNFNQKGVRGLRPTSVPRCMANALSSQISMRFRLVGPNYVVVAACTSSTAAMGIAFRMIRDGYIDRVLCGGADAVFDPCFFAAWNNLGVMSRNPDPTKACRPFDRDRDGCVLGEGAAALVFESLESAAARGAAIRAEICGFGESSDAEHLTHPNAEGQAAAIRAALASARMSPGDIGLVNAHGTATPANDECEGRSIRLALGPAADSIPVSANKSFFGHLIGASGALETVVSLLSLEKGLTPPNLNLENPDPACPLRLIRPAPEKISKAVAMKNSFGFGGSNAVLILRRWEG